MVSNLFNFCHQMAFYGAYHSNKHNIAIHTIGVPVLIWSGLVFAASLPWPASFAHAEWHPASGALAPYLAVELNWGLLMASFYWVYYFALEPLTAILYLPQWVPIYMTAAATAHRPGGLALAAWLHVAAWIAQFIGHGVFEGRAPALLDNLLGAVVLAPFFVHIEMLFAFGYKPELHREVNNAIGVEVAKFRRNEGDAARAASKKASSSTPLLNSVPS